MLRQKSRDDIVRSKLVDPKHMLSQIDKELTLDEHDLVKTHTLLETLDRRAHA
jgi:hypothetical protein